MNKYDRPPNKKLQNMPVPQIKKLQNNPLITPSRREKERGRGNV